MKRSVIGSFALLFLLAAAAAQDVRYNYDKSADFSRFKTYTWVVLKGASKLDDITEKNIKASVDAQLASKGLTKVDSANADLFVGMQTAVGGEKQLTMYSTGWGYGPGWYGGWYGPRGGITTAQTSTIYTGQLTLDFYDSVKRELVWRGVASKTLNPKASPEKQQKNLDKAMGKLLKNFPPPVKK